MSGLLPFKPGDWVADSAERVGRVKSVYSDLAWEPGAILLDIVMYSRNGDKLGRVSPYCGGPRSFEPCMNAADWRRIAEPDFPISLKWVPDKNGKATARYWAGDTLPPANWAPKPRRARYVSRPDDDRLRRALKQIADGHNDARQLAKDTLQHS
jgi:hypothetical protein